MRIIISLLIMASVTPLFSQSVKVMSYNIRYDNKGDGVNQWSNRKEKVAALIRKHDPDLIGLQEALLNQISDLITLLPAYSYFGKGREDGASKGEFSAILVKRTRFDVLADSTFWLSETPGAAGSKGWDAQLPRVATWTKLLDKKNRQTLLYLNTHFDHIGVEARNNSAKLIRDYLAEASVPVIMTGDLNVERTTEAYTTISAGKLLDSKPSADNTPTFCGFEVATTDCKAIDYILHTRDFKVSSYSVLKDNDGHYYPSDHMPVIAEFITVKGK